MHDLVWPSTSEYLRLHDYHPPFCKKSNTSQRFELPQLNGRSSISQEGEAATRPSSIHLYRLAFLAIADESSKA